MKSTTKNTLKLFFQYSLKHKYLGATMLGGALSASFLSVLAPLFYKRFFDALASGRNVDSVVPQLFGNLIAIGLIGLGSWLGWRIATFTANRFESRVMTELTNYCFAYLHRHSFSFFNNSFVGSLVKKVKWFGRSYETIADRITWNLLPLVMNIAVIAVVLFQRNVYLGLGVCGWVVIFILINFIFASYKLRYDVLRSEAETKTTSFLADTVTNNVSVKLFTGYKREVSGFAAVNDELRHLRRFTWDLDSVFEATQGFLMIFLEVGIFFLAVHLWRQNILTVGDFVLIQAYLVTIFNRVWDFGRVVRQIYEALADAAEMTEILDTPHEIRDTVSAKKLKVGIGAIEFAQVDFYYHETRRVLKDFNLRIAPKEHVALIGPSGAGKTTIIRLLLRMHELTAGQILIDGQDIAQVTQESLWENVSLVPQDPVLFHRTLRENIGYGRPKASAAAIIAAAKAAHCHEFISRSPEKYETYVGERGIKLSGGERQRVAIARAILRGAPILVLDEATSSLDSESELLIQDALDKLMRDKTVIVIAHRLSTIRKMDRIVVVDEGGIMESGTHDELLKNSSGIYNRLWRLQAGGFIK